MIDRRPVTKAFIEMLATATGKPVGAGRMPTNDAGELVDPPYYIVYSVGSTVSGAPLADDNEDASFVYQVTSVSAPDPDIAESYGTQDQTEWHADKARRAVLERDPDTGAWVNTLTVSGVSCMARSLETEPGGTNDPADATMGYDQRFRLDLTPAT
jgi:hypothetical protein